MFKMPWHVATRFGLIVLTFSSTSIAQNTDSVSTARRLALETQSWTAVEIRVQTDIIAEAPNNSPRDYDSMDEHYIETASGKRMYDVRFLLGKKMTNHIDYFRNIDLCMDINYRRDDPERQGGAVIKRYFANEDRGERTQRPLPLLLFYVGKRPLHEALLEVAPSATSKVLGRRCRAFLFKGVRWAAGQDQIYYLDESTSIPLKAEAFPGGASADATGPLWTWTAGAIDTVGGHHLPLESTMKSYAPAMSWKARVRSIEFDKTYPDSTFWPDLQPGVSVLDSIARKSYTVPGEVPENAPRGKPEQVAAPVEAHPPSDWSSVYAGALLVFGTGLVAIGVYLRRKRE
jgi:hypothetical protein